MVYVSPRAASYTDRQYDMFDVVITHADNSVTRWESVTITRVAHHIETLHVDDTMEIYPAERRENFRTLVSNLIGHNHD